MASYYQSLMVSRRTILAATGVCIASAGCLSTESTGGAVDIDSVSIHNDDEVTHTLAIVITTGDEAAVFEETVSVDPNAGRSLSDPVTDAADYTVAVSLGETTVRERATEYATESQSCALPVVRIDSGGQLFLEFRTFDSC